MVEQPRPKDEVVMSKFLFVVRFKSMQNGKLSAPKDCRLTGRNVKDAANKCRTAKNGGRILSVHKLKRFRT